MGCLISNAVSAEHRTIVYRVSSDDPLLVCSRHNGLWSYTVELREIGETLKASMRNFPSFRPKFSQDFGITRDKRGNYIGQGFELKNTTSRITGFFDFKANVEGLPEPFHDEKFYVIIHLGFGKDLVLALT